MRSRRSQNGVRSRQINWHRVMTHGTFQWTRRLDGWALFAFAAGSCFLFGYNQLRAVGIMMFVAFVLANVARPGAAFRRLFPIPPELKCYTLWVVWALVTGPLVVVNQAKFLAASRVLVQVFVLVWGAYAVLRQLRSVDVVLVGMIAGVVAQIGLVAAGVGSIVPTSIMDSAERIAGSTHNPNALAFLMILSVVAMLFFWKSSAGLSLTRRVLLSVICLIAGSVVLASGSRKSTIALAVILYLWLVFARGSSRGMKRALATIVVGAIVLSAVVGYGPKLIEGTEVGRRFADFSEQGGGDVIVAAQRNIRFAMYVDGWRMFTEHPVFGVGLNNFGAYFYTGQYSHSNIMEPLATTGVVGFILYQAFFVLVMVRAWRLLQVVRSPLLRYRLRVVIVGMVGINTLGLGAPLYTGGPVFLLLVAFSVLTFRLQTESRGALKEARTAARQSRRVNPDARLVRSGGTARSAVPSGLPGKG